MRPAERFLLVVEATSRGGAVTVVQELSFTTQGAAVAMAEQLQQDFDADAEPKRAYVLDQQGIRIWAGGARGRPPEPTPTPTRRLA